MSGDGFVDVVMPQMGVSVTEGTVVRWLVAPGDQVSAEQPVCEIATDKVDTEVTAPADGKVLEIIAAEGTTVDVGLPLARLGPATVTVATPAAAVAPPPAAPAPAAKPLGDGVASVPTPPSNGPASPAPAPASPASAPPSWTPEAPSSSAPPAFSAVHPEAAPAASPAVPRANGANGQPRLPRRPVSESLAGAHVDPIAAAEAALARPGRSGLPLASPRARTLARKHRVDLATIAGTGRSGRIRAGDILSSVAPAPAAPPAATRPAAAAIAQSAGSLAMAAAPMAAPAGGALPPGYEDVPYEVLPTSQHRRAISEHMIRSRQTAAHMTTEVDVDLHRASEVRGELNVRRARSTERRLSFLALIARAAIAALEDFPELNATFQHERSIHWREVNLGVAVDTPSGLIVPVIRGADRLKVGSIADAIATLAERARLRTLQIEELRAGTFTISNPGSVGAVSAPAIINQPQVAILGMPTIVKRPWVVTSPDCSDSIAIRPIMRLALTFDHRAVDGAYATRYLVKVKEYLERWDARAYL